MRFFAWPIFCLTHVTFRHAPSIKLKLASKPWLAINEANRSPVVWEHFARRLLVMFLFVVLLSLSNEESV